MADPTPAELYPSRADEPLRWVALGYVLWGKGVGHGDWVFDSDTGACTNIHGYPNTRPPYPPMLSKTTLPAVMSRASGSLLLLLGHALALAYPAQVGTGLGLAQHGSCL